MSRQANFVAKVICSTLALAGLAMSAMGYGYTPIDPALGDVFQNVVVGKLKVDIPISTFFKILVRNILLYLLHNLPHSYRFTRHARDRRTYSFRQRRQCWYPKVAVLQESFCKPI